MDTFDHVAIGANLKKPALETPKPLNIAFLSDVDSSVDWDDIKDGDVKDEPTELMRAHWLRAIETKNWVQVGFFMGELQDKGKLKDSELGLMKTVTLAAAGATAEALQELDSARDGLKDGAKRDCAKVMLSHFKYSQAVERSNQLAREITGNSMKEVSSQANAREVSHE
jgi:hypothetical protein